jgi:hypothetical protein
LKQAQLTPAESAELQNAMNAASESFADGHSN